VSWAGDGTITYTVYDSTDSQLATVSTTDNTYSDADGNGVGWSSRGDSVGGNSTTIIYDDWRIV